MKLTETTKKQTEGKSSGIFFRKLISILMMLVLLFDAVPVTVWAEPLAVDVTEPQNLKDKLLIPDYSKGKCQMLLSDMISQLSILNGGALLNVQDVTSVQFTAVQEAEADQVEGWIAYNNIPCTDVGPKDFLLTWSEDFTENDRLDITLRDGETIHVSMMYGQVMEEEHTLTEGEYTCRTLEDYSGLLDLINPPAKNTASALRTAKKSASDSENQRVTGYTAYEIELTDSAALATLYQVTVPVHVDMLQDWREPDQDLIIKDVQFKLHHIHTDEKGNTSKETITPDVRQENGVISSFTFAVRSFSSFVLEYTVDFVYIEKKTEISIDLGNFQANSNELGQLLYKNSKGLEELAVSDILDFAQDYLQDENVCGEVYTVSLQNGTALSDFDQNFFANSAVSIEGKGIEYGSGKITLLESFDEAKITFASEAGTLELTLENYTAAEKPVIPDDDDGFSYRFFTEEASIAEILAANEIVSSYYIIISLSDENLVTIKGDEVIAENYFDEVILTLSLSDGTTVEIALQNPAPVKAGETVTTEGVGSFAAKDEVPAGTVLTVNTNPKVPEGITIPGTDRKSETVSDPVFFDISLIGPDGKEIQTGASVTISTEIALPQEDGKVTKVTGVKVYHIGEKGDVEELEGAMYALGEGKIRSVSFTTVGFSLFAVTYTVDFVSSEVPAAWSWPGQGSYSIASILEEIGVEGTVESVTLERVEDKGGSKKALYLSDDHTELISEEAFLDTFELKVVVDGTEYVFTITDVAYSSDLTEFLTSDGVTLIGADYDEGAGKYKPKKGQPYTLLLHFKEIPDSKQFTLSSDGTQILDLTYQIPAGITAFQTSGSMPGNGFTLDYTVDSNGLVTFHWNVTDQEKFNKTLEAQDVDILFYLQATFNENTTAITFQNSETLDIEVDDNAEVTVEKTGYFSSDDHKMHYIVTVTSNGVNSNVTLTDTIDSDAKLTYNNDAAANTTGVNITNNTNGFSATIPQMYDGDTVSFTYTADVDFSKLSKSETPENGIYKYGTVAETKNGVTVQSTEDTTPDTKDYSLDHQITLSSISKGNAEKDNTVVDGKRTLNWTIQANQERIVSMNGVTITDTITEDPKNLMSYSGTGITVIKRDRTQSWDAGTTVTIPWGSDGLVLAADGRSWTYTPSDTDIYWYEIRYTTEVDVSDQIVDYDVKNKVENQYGSSEIGGTAEALDEKRVGIEKVATNYDKVNKQISWEVTIDVPPQGLDKAVLKDTFPNAGGVLANRTAYDTLVGTIENGIAISGLQSGDTYTITPTTQQVTVGETTENWIVGFQINFKKKNNTDGLTGTNTKYSVKVTFKTKVDEDWYDVTKAGESYQYDHTNSAELEYSPNLKISDSDTVTINPIEPGIDKTTLTAASNNEIIWKISENAYLPAWKYYITLSGISDSAFETENQDGSVTAHDLIITDTYNSTYLALLDANGTDSDIRIYDGNWRNYSGHIVPVVGNNNYDYQRTVPVASESNPGTITFTIKKDELPKTAAGNYYPYYRIEYILHVKDSAALTALKNAAADQNAGVISLGNSATWQGVGSSNTNVTYEEKIVDKTAVVNGINPETGNYEVTYTIRINPNGYQIGDSPYIEAEDAYANLSIDYTSVSCSPADALVEMRRQTGSNGEPDKVIYVLKNATPITLTYKGSVQKSGTYTNTVTVNGQKSTTDGTWTVESGGSVTSNDYKITVLKHDSENVLNGLAGAEFDLYRKSDNKLLKSGLVTDQDGKILIDTIPREDGQGEVDLAADTTYYLIETKAPVSSDGVEYVIDTDTNGNPVHYEFTIQRVGADYGEGSAWLFLNNDILAIRNWPKSEETITLNIKKIWEGVGSGQMPASVTVHLYRKTDKLANTGELVQDIVLTASDAQADETWAKEISNLPKSTVINSTQMPYYYFIAEEPISGYEVVYSDGNRLGLKNSGTLSVTNKKISITVNKVWQNENGAAITDSAVLATLPSINVYLRKIGSNDNVQTATLTAPDFTHTWTGLDSGFTYYVVEEKDANDYTAGGAKYIGVTYTDENGTELTNLSVDGTATVVNQLQSVKVKKVWTSSNDDNPLSAEAITAAGLDSVTVTANLLNSSGTIVRTAQLSSANGWEATWTGLDFRQTYTVTESDVNGYYLNKIAYKNASGSVGFNDPNNDNAWVVYTTPQAGGSIELVNKPLKYRVVKEWDGAMPSGITSITVELLRDGVVQETVTLDANTKDGSQRWYYEWNNLPQGNYTVEEVVPEGSAQVGIVYYGSDNSTNHDDGTGTYVDNTTIPANGYAIITNKITKPLQIIKQWPAGTDTTGLFATVKLYSVDLNTSDGTPDDSTKELVGTYTLDHDNSFTVTVTNGLDASKHYIVEEVSCSDGFNLGSIVYAFHDGRVADNLVDNNSGHHYFANIPAIPYKEDTAGNAKATLTNTAFQPDDTKTHVTVYKQWADGNGPVTGTEIATVKLIRYMTEMQGTVIHILEGQHLNELATVVGSLNSNVTITLPLRNSLNNAAKILTSPPSGDYNAITGVISCTSLQDNDNHNNAVTTFSTRSNTNVYMVLDYWPDYYAYPLDVVNGRVSGVTITPEYVNTAQPVLDTTFSDKILNLRPSNSYTGTFYNLDISGTQNGQNYYYTYSVVETSPSTGFTTQYKVGNGEYKDTLTAADAVGGAGTKTITVKNTRTTSTTTSVSITKTWADDGDKFGLRPSAENYANMVNLYVAESDEAAIAADATPVEITGDITKTVTNNNDNTYTVTFGNLPVLSGTQVYKVKEDTTALTNYTASADTAVHGGSITNTLKTGSLTVTKALDGLTENDATANADKPFAVTITTMVDDAPKYLNASGELVDTDPGLTVSKNTGLAISNVPVGTYTVTETATDDAKAITGYIFVSAATDPAAGSVEVTDEQTASVVITNTYSDKTGEYTVTKAWQTKKGQTTTAASWPTSGYMAVNSVTLELWQHTEGAEDAAVAGQENQTILSTDDPKSAHWIGLDNLTGSEYYYAKEVSANVTVGGTTTDVTGEALAALFAPALNAEHTTLTNTLELVDIPVTKAWQNSAGTAVDADAASVTVGLYDAAGSTAVTKDASGADLPDGGTITLNSGNSWSGSFASLPKRDASGSVISYTVKETAVGSISDASTIATVYGSGTSATVTAGNSATLTNVVQTVEIDVTKTWDGITPNANTVAEFTVYADGAAYQVNSADLKVTLPLTVGETNGKGETVTEENKWTDKVLNLPKYNASGSEIVWSVQETRVVYPNGTENVTLVTPEAIQAVFAVTGDGEVTVDSTTGIGQKTITNTKIPTVNITATKAWDASVTADQQPTAIQFTLLRKDPTDPSNPDALVTFGAPVQVITKPASGAWPTAEWTDLPKNVDDTATPKVAYQYTVEETGVYFGALTTDDPGTTEDEGGQVPSDAVFVAPSMYTVSGGNVTFGNGENANIGAATITNAPKTVDVPVEKTWAAYEGNGYYWTAEFQLEYADVHVDGTPTSESAVSDYTPVTGMPVKTIAKGQAVGDRTFSGLPMYHIYSNGAVYRVKYAVTEKAYNVYEGADNTGTLILHWDDTNGLTTGTDLYAPDYAHDAGDIDIMVTSVDDARYYSIIVNNVLDQRHDEEPLMNITIQKDWENSSSLDSSRYAKFKLQRYKSESYREFGSEYDGTTTYTVMMNGQEYSFPAGSNIYLVAEFKSDVTGAIVYHWNEHDQTQLGKYNATPTVYRTDNAVITNLSANVSITYTDSENLLVNTYPTNLHPGNTPEGPDTVWNNSAQAVTVTLNNGNNWRDTLSNLKRVEGGEVTGNRQTVYTYSYYFVEDSDMSPANYYAVYTKDNASGAPLGDKDHRVTNTSTVYALNKPIPPFKVVKNWLEVLDQDKDNMPTVYFAVYRLVDGQSNFNEAERYLPADPNAYYELSNANGWSWTCDQYLPPTNEQGLTYHYFVVERTASGNYDDTNVWVDDTTLYSGNYAITMDGYRYRPTVDSGDWLPGNSTTTVNLVDDEGHSTGATTTITTEGKILAAQPHYVATGNGGLTGLTNTGEIEIRNKAPKYMQMDIKKKFLRLKLNDTENGYELQTLTSDVSVMHDLVLKIQVEYRAILDTPLTVGDNFNVTSGTMTQVFGWTTYGSPVYVGYGYSDGTVAGSPVCVNHNVFNIRYAGNWHWTIDNQDQNKGLLCYGFENYNGVLTKVRYQYRLVELGAYQAVDSAGNTTPLDNTEYDWTAILPAVWDGNGQQIELFPRVEAQDQDRLVNVQTTNISIDKQWKANTDVQEVYVKVFRQVGTNDGATLIDYTNAIVANAGVNGQDGQVEANNITTINGESYLILRPGTGPVMINHVFTMPAAANGAYYYKVQECGYKDASGNIHWGNDQFLPEYSATWTGADALTPANRMIILGKKGNSLFRIINTPTTDFSVSKVWKVNGTASNPNAPWTIDGEQLIDAVEFKVTRLGTKYTRDDANSAWTANGDTSTDVLTFAENGGTDGNLLIRAQGKRARVVAQTAGGTAYSVEYENISNAWTTVVDGLQKLNEVSSTEKWEYSYKVEEVAVKAGNTTVDASTYTVALSTTDALTDHGTVTITNDKTTTGSLTVTKTLTVANGTGDDLTFYVGLFTRTGDTEPYTYTLVPTANVEGGNPKAITVAANKTSSTATFSNLTIGTEYWVFETTSAGVRVTASDKTSGYSIAPASVNGVHVTIAQTTAAGITNEYSADGTATFSGNKNITNRNFKEGDSFTVRVESTANAPMPGDTAAGTVYIKTFTLTAEDVENNATSFAYALDAISYSLSDIPAGQSSATFTYTVTESAQNMEGVSSVDGTSYTVTVTISDHGDGTLNVVKSENYNALNFTNTYDADTTATISGTKAVTNGGNDLSGYSFTLAGVDGAPVPDTVTATSAADGSFSFETITYTMAQAMTGTLSEGVYTKNYTYHVTENLPAGAEAATEAERTAHYAIRNGIKYDLSEKTVTVAVTYNTATGEMGTTVTPDQAGVLFTNEQLGSVKVTKTFSGVASLPDNFQITASWGTAPDNQSIVLNISNAGYTGTLPTGITVTKSGTGTTEDPYEWIIGNLPIGTVVTFTEENYTVAGYNVTATVSNDGLSTAAVEPGTVAFTNQYVAGVELPSTGGSGTLPYTLTGLTLLLGASFWLLLRKKIE